MTIDVPLTVDGVTDCAPAIQAALNLGGTVRLPAGDIGIHSPLVVTQPNTRLLGEKGRTRLFPYFGSGHSVVVQPTRPFPYTIQPSLVSGPGGSVRRPTIPLDTEPALARLAGGNQLTVAYFFRRESAPPEAAVHVFCGSNYGHAYREPWSVWDYFGTLRFAWNGLYHVAQAGVAQDVGTVYFVALTYDGTRVRLLVAEPGQPLVEVAGVNATGNVPMYPNGLDVVAIGYDVAGVHGSLQSHGPPDASFDGLEFASAVRYQPGDLAPAAKPAVQSGSRLVLNFETQDPFFVGRRDHAAPTAYILPTNSSETQRAGFEISGITFMGAFDASGPVFWDTIASKASDLDFVSAWYGITFRGTTYASKVRDLGGTAACVYWLQTSQAEDTTVSGVSPSAGGIPFVTAGAVGGSYTTLYVSPLGGALCSVYCTGSNEINVFHGQVDDEGQNPGGGPPVICDNAQVKLTGVQVVRQTPGPLVLCANGGTVSAQGCWFAAPPGTAELVQFRDPPAVMGSVLGSRIDPPGVTVTLSPQYLIYVQGFKLFVPSMTVSTQS